MFEPLVHEYRVYKIRWLQLFIYILITLANAINSVTFAPIEDPTTKFYGISSTQVNALAIVFLFLYIAGTALSIWLSQKYPIRTIMIVGAMLNMGTYVRLLSLIAPKKWFSYAALLIGQIFPAIGAPFFLNSTALLAARWFAPSQRDIATAIASMANPLGLAIGSLLPSLIVDDKNPSSNQFVLLLLIEAGFTAFVTVLLVLLFKSDPPSPPSPSEQHHQVINLKQDLLNLLSNFHYLTLLLGFSVGLALFNALTTLLAQIIKPSGYSSDDAGYFGAIIIVAGLFNAFIVGVIMDITHAYRIILKVLLVGACGSGIFFIIILRPDHIIALAFSIGLMGFFLLPLLPVSFECAVECTYPIRAEWSTGLLMCAGNALGGVFIFVMGYLITMAPEYKSGEILTPSSIFVLCFFVISTGALLTYRGPYKRLEAERMSSTESSDMITQEVVNET